MRHLRDFNAREWLEILPLQHAFKQVRNDAWLRFYLSRQPAQLQSFLAQTAHLKDKNIALVVAFEHPWMLSWLIRMAKRNLLDTQLLVFDNSRRAQPRLEIEAVCRDSGTPYLALPHNFTRHVNRSHGMAMTWIFHNVVRAIMPRMFAYLDHDLIPVEPVALSDRMGDQPMYGLPNVSPWGWHLWAGYCMYSMSQVMDAPLNFLHDFSRGLDTGGRNWRPLYRKHDHAKLKLARIQYLDVTDPVNRAAFQFQEVDRSWLHIGGIGYNDNYRLKAGLSRRIAEAFDAGASWGEIRKSGTLSFVEASGNRPTS